MSKRRVVEQKITQLHENVAITMALDLMSEILFCLGCKKVHILTFATLFANTLLEPEITLEPFYRRTAMLGQAGCCN